MAKVIDSAFFQSIAMPASARVGTKFVLCRELATISGVV